MGNEIKKDYLPTTEATVQDIPRRVAFIKRDTTAAVRETDELMVMSFPHLVVRGAICLHVLVIVLALISLAFDAPLKHIADPLHTEVPAKAPWYFLGLQELLHYFPPLVAGVLIPVLVVFALVLIPYSDVNLKAEPLWSRNKHRRFAVLTAVVVILVAANGFFHAWAISIPTFLLYLFAGIPYFSNSGHGPAGWLRKVTLPSWIMTWFVVEATVLTVIGVFFRGPYWKWSWPWIEGIY